MASCSLQIALDGPDRVFRFGQTIRGHVEVEVFRDCNCRALTVVLGWSAEGSGQRDGTSVEAIELPGGPWPVGTRHRFPFTFELPPGPASYGGEAFDVTWCVRARADLRWEDVEAAEPIDLVGDGREDPDLGPAYQPPVVRSERERTGGKFILLASGLFWAGLGLLLAAYTLGNLAHLDVALVLAPRSGVLLPFAFSLLAVVGGLAMAAWQVRLDVVASITDELILSVTPRIATGGDALDCSALLRSGPGMAIEQLTLALSCEERWRKVQPASEKEDADWEGAPVWSHEEMLAEHRQVRPGEVVRLQATLGVPPAAAPTFMADHHSLLWIVSLHALPTGQQDLQRRLRVTVLPSRADVRPAPMAPEPPPDMVAPEPPLVETEPPAAVEEVPAARQNVAESP